MTNTFYQLWTVPKEIRLENCPNFKPDLQMMSSFLKYLSQNLQKHREMSTYLSEWQNLLEQNKATLIDTHETLSGYSGKMNHIIIHFEEISIISPEDSMNCLEEINEIHGTYIIGAVINKNINNLQSSYRELSMSKNRNNFRTAVPEIQNFLDNISPSEPFYKEKKESSSFLATLFKRMCILDNQIYHTILPFYDDSLYIHKKGVIPIKINVNPQESFHKYYEECEINILTAIFSYLWNDAQGWNNYDIYPKNKDISHREKSYNSKHQIVYIHGGAKSFIKKLLSFCSLQQSDDMFVESLMYNEQTNMLMQFVLVLRKRSDDGHYVSKRILFEDSKYIVPMEIWDFHKKLAQLDYSINSTQIMPTLEHHPKWEEGCSKKECKTPFLALNFDNSQVGLLLTKLLRRNYMDSTLSKETIDEHPLNNKNIGEYILEQMLLCSQTTSTLLSTMYFYTDMYWNINLYRVHTLPLLANYVYLTTYYACLAIEKPLIRQILLPSPNSAAKIRDKLEEGYTVKDTYLKRSIPEHENIFLKHLLDANEATLNSYYPGHTDMYQLFAEKAYIYDCNSLYPYIMSTKSFPSGNPVKWCGEKLDKCFGFLHVRISCPKMHKPILPYRPDTCTSSYYVEGEWEAWYFSEEIKYAVKCGYQVVRILDGYLYHDRIKGSDYFGEFVNYFSQMKSISFENFQELFFAQHNIYPSRLSPTLDKCLKSLYIIQTNVSKLIMNSTYGKISHHRLYPRQKLILTDTTDETEKDGDNFTKVNKFYSIEGSIFESRYKIGQEAFNFKNGSDLKIGVAITSYARIYMHETFFNNSQNNVLYIDTDCVITNSPISPELIHESKLGKFKNVLKKYWNPRLTQVAAKKYKDKDFAIQDLCITGIRNYAYKSKNYPKPFEEDRYFTVSSIGPMAPEDSKKVHQISKIILETLYDPDIPMMLHSEILLTDVQETLSEWIRSKCDPNMKIIREEYSTSTFETKQNQRMEKHLPATLIHFYVLMNCTSSLEDGYLPIRSLRDVFQNDVGFPWRNYVFNENTMTSIKCTEIKKEKYVKYTSFPWRIQMQPTKYQLPLELDPILKMIKEKEEFLEMEKIRLGIE